MSSTRQQHSNRGTSSIVRNQAKTKMRINGPQTDAIHYTDMRRDGRKNESQMEQCLTILENVMPC